jgi:hypothetical protein
MNSNELLEIDGFFLEQTSAGCPEQYDVYDCFGNLVGYIRERHGSFRCDYIGFGNNKTIYSANTDSYEDESDYYIYRALQLLKDELRYNY